MKPAAAAVHEGAFINYVDMARGGVNQMPKICPHGLWMTPNRDLDKGLTWGLKNIIRFKEFLSIISYALLPVSTHFSKY